MSLDVYLTAVRPCSVYDANITHNLNTMADAAGLYEFLWHPEKVGIVYAKDLIDPLKQGLERLVSEPEKYRAFNPENGWGSYDGLVKFVRRYLDACCENPDAEVRVSR
jgi:hypothetical protein